MRLFVNQAGLKMAERTRTSRRNASPEHESSISSWRRWMHQRKFILPDDPGYHWIKSEKSKGITEASIFFLPLLWKFSIFIKIAYLTIVAMGRYLDARSRKVCILSHAFRIPVVSLIRTDRGWPKLNVVLAWDRYYQSTYQCSILLRTKRPSREDAGGMWYCITMKNGQTGL